MNTMVEFKEALEENNGKVSGFKVSEAAVRSWFKEAGASVPSSLADVSKGMNQSEWRITLCVSSLLISTPFIFLSHFLLFIAALVLLEWKFPECLVAE